MVGLVYERGLRVRDAFIFPKGAFAVLVERVSDHSGAAHPTSYMRRWRNLPTGNWTAGR